jgi:glycosyltransferase involved in cell wall biosynthesis
VVLALSLDTPVIAARTPTYRELLGEERSGWLFTPHDAGSLRDTLIRAADPGSAAVRGMHAAETVSGRDWPEVGRLTAEVLLAD